MVAPLPPDPDPVAPPAPAMVAVPVPPWAPTSTDSTLHGVTLSVAVASPPKLPVTPLNPPPPAAPSTTAWRLVTPGGTTKVSDPTVENVHVTVAVPEQEGAAAAGPAPLARVARPRSTQAAALVHVPGVRNVTRAASSAASAQAR